MFRRFWAEFCVGFLPQSKERTPTRTVNVKDVTRVTDGDE